MEEKEANKDFVYNATEVSKGFVPKIQIKNPSKESLNAEIIKKCRKGVGSNPSSPNTSPRGHYEESSKELSPRTEGLKDTYNLSPRSSAPGKRRPMQEIVDVGEMTEIQEVDEDTQEMLELKKQFREKFQGHEKWRTNSLEFQRFATAFGFMKAILEIQHNQNELEEHKQKQIKLLKQILNNNSKEATKRHIRISSNE